MDSVSAPSQAADVSRVVAPGPPVHVVEARPTFREVFEAECAYVWTTLRRLGVAERDVEDVAHETFLRVAAHLHEYEPSRPLRAWLFVFTLRMARDYRRLARHRHETIGAQDDAPEEGRALPDELVAAREGHALVLRALDALDWDKRVVFVACELEEREVAEVAATLGIPRNTAASRLRLARGEFTITIRRLAARGARP
jgi:RNA polymerase sigma-70 factor (ECF subfamily)